MQLSSDFYIMSVLYDANALFDAGTKAMSGSKFKQSTQIYKMNQLLNTAKLQKSIMDGTYEPSQGTQFLIKERGKERYITSNTMLDKTVNHVICDELLTPAISKYLIYDNGSSQKGKGVDFHRKRLRTHLHKYYTRHGTNEGYILLSDFSGYYPNIPHDKCKEMLEYFITKECSPEDAKVAIPIIEAEFKTFEKDVSRFSDEEIQAMYTGKIEATMNYMVDKSLLTGEKKLAKGVDIGNQISQDIGIVYPHRVDNYIKIVRGVEFYARYTDDTYMISDSKDQLIDVFEGAVKIAEDFGIIINRRKTRICKLSDWFRILQIAYRLTDTGEVPMKINPLAITRERQKLKAYKRLLDCGERNYFDIENDFKGWLGSNYKYMSFEQIRNIIVLYDQLFERTPQWEKGRLRWMTDKVMKIREDDAYVGI